MNNNDNKWNNFIHSPLLIAVVVSTLIVTVYSASQKDGLYSYYKYDYSTPFLTLFMKGIADGATPFYVSEEECCNHIYSMNTGHPSGSPNKLSQ